jgi:hypothetical protein
MEPYFLARIGAKGLVLEVSAGAATVYHLLCMINGFAFAEPFCEWIKVNLTRG